MYSKISENDDDGNKQHHVVLVLEEVDGHLSHLIRTGQPVIQNKHLPTPVKNKDEWSTMFDEINKGLFKNLIVVMTSNVYPTDITADSSFFRPGRVDKVISFF